MDVNVKHCIVNAWVGGGWYPKGQERLARSLIFHGSTADPLFFQGGWPVGGYNEDCYYNIKASCIEKAIELGYKRILWLDCSVWAVSDPMAMWDVINDDGYFLWKSGFNCAQVCSDRCLEYFGVTRDEAELMDDCSTSIFGVNMDNPTGRQFIEMWIQSAKDGIFESSRHRDERDSKDQRFLFARQDQMCASVIAGKLGMKMHNPNELTAYYHPDNTDLVFQMRGI